MLTAMSWVVADLMTRDVVKIKPSTTSRECVRLMRMHGVGALPVVEDGRLVGIVTMTDLVLKEYAPAASKLMTSRVKVVHPETPITGAVRVMFEHRVNRLPVVDGDGRLLGIISRSDVMRIFLRSDISIRQEVADAVLGDLSFIGDGTIWAEVHDGVVTLQGEVEPGTLTEVLLRLVAGVPGVAGVKNRLTTRSNVP
jgi:CBS domain-containing protein